MAAEKVQYQQMNHVSYISQFMKPSNLIANQEEKDPFAETGKMKIQKAKQERKLFEYS